MEGTGKMLGYVEKKWGQRQSFSLLLFQWLPGVIVTCTPLCIIHCGVSIQKQAKRARIQKWDVRPKLSHGSKVHGLWFHLQNHTKKDSKVCFQLRLRATPHVTWVQVGPSRDEAEHLLRGRVCTAMACHRQKYRQKFSEELAVLCAL